MDKETVYRKLEELGLERIEYTERAMYKLNLVEESTQTAYPLILTTHTCDQGDTIVKFEEVDFGCGDAVPRSVRKAALDKLLELEQLFVGQSHHASEAVQSGAMAPNEQEMRKLGEDMKRMKTNAELLENNLVPDPIQ